MPEKVKAVKYIGVATTRIITEQEWSRINVKSQPTIKWDATNGFTVMGKYLKPDAVTYLREDDGFVVLQEDESG